MNEPARNRDINSLQRYFKDKIKALLDNMTRLGFDPVIYEAKRSPERQKWLFGVGRTHDTSRKPVTWTLKSEHLTGNAVDIVSHSKLWSNPKFFARLKIEAKKLGLHVIPQEQCHVQAKEP